MDACLHYLTQCHTQLKLIFVGIQVFIAQHRVVREVFDSRVKLHSLWHEEDLEKLEQTLGFPLQIDYLTEVCIHTIRENYYI